MAEETKDSMGINAPEDESTRDLAETRKSSKINFYYDNAKKLEKEINFSVFIGGGLYQIAIGMVISLIVSFIISLPVIMAYPYFSPVLYWSLWMFGWALILLGSITILFPFLRRRLGNDDNITHAIQIVVKINAILLMIFIPVGLFLGLGIRKYLLSEESNDKKTKNGLISKLQNVPIIFYFMVIGGITHLLLGVVFILVPSLIPRDLYFLIYPYINENLLTFISSLGWISFTSGLIIFIFSFMSWKINPIDDISEGGMVMKLSRYVIIGAAAVMCLVFPIGTFFGLTLIFEMQSKKSKHDSSVQVEPS